MSVALLLELPVADWGARGYVPGGMGRKNAALLRYRWMDAFMGARWMQPDWEGGTGGGDGGGWCRGGS